LDKLKQWHFLSTSNKVTWPTQKIKLHAGVKKCHFLKVQSGEITVWPAFSSTHLGDTQLIILQFSTYYHRVPEVAVVASLSAGYK
jgi:hypothetical protein